MQRWSIGLGLVVSACTLANQVDVCDRAQSPQIQLNRSRTEGDQRVGSLRAVAPMPAGGALAVFRSAASGNPVDQRSEISGALIDSEGNPISTCGQPNEHTYAAATGSLEDVQVRGNAAVVAPANANDDAIGLLAWVEDHDDAMLVHALGLDIGGCPLGVDPVLPFEVASFTPGCTFARDASAARSVCATGTSIARLSATAFVVAWSHVEIEGGLATTTDIYARVLEVDFLGITPRATVLSAVGDAAPILADGRPIAFSTVRLDEDRFMLLWQESGGDRLSMLARSYDSDLEAQPSMPPFHDVATDELPPGGVRVDGAYDGERVLVVWTQREGREASRVFGLFLAPDGTTLDGPEGAMPFRISDATDGEESEPAVTTFEGGFFVTWVALDSTLAGDGSASALRAAVFDAGGQRRFVNAACDRASFQLNRGADGDQRWPALATLSSGQVMAIWTDEGRNGPDISGSSVAAVVEDRRSLLPVE